MYFDHPRIKKFIFAGHYLGSHQHEKLVFHSKSAPHTKPIDFCKKQDLVLFTAINGVHPFMQAVEHELNS